LKLYDECLVRKFPDPTPIEASASKIIESSLKTFSSQVQSSPSKIDVNLSSVKNTFVLEKSANADDVVFLGSLKD